MLTYWNYMNSLIIEIKVVTGCLTSLCLHCADFLAKTDHAHLDDVRPKIQFWWLAAMIWHVLHISNHYVNSKPVLLHLMWHIS